MQNMILTRKEIEAEVKRLELKIHGLGAFEVTEEWHWTMKHLTEQREVLVNYLKRIDSTDPF